MNLLHAVLPLLQDSTDVSLAMANYLLKTSIPTPVTINQELTRRHKLVLDFTIGFIDYHCNFTFSEGYVYCNLHTVSGVCVGDGDVVIAEQMCSELQTEVTCHDLLDAVQNLEM